MKGLKKFKEENGHVIDGQWYPRVTKILSIKSKPQLYHYYAKAESFQEAEDAKDKSAEEGTLIHNTIEEWLKNKETIIPEEIVPSVDAFKDFYYNIKPEIIAIEEEFVHPTHRYSGTADLVAKIDNKFYLLDIKTGKSIYKDYRLQTAAYVDALPYDFVGRMIIRLAQYYQCNHCTARLFNKGGMPSVSIPYDENNKSAYGEAKMCEHEWGDMVGEVEVEEFDNQEQDFKAFLACKELWEWENREMLEAVHYLSTE